jgi:cobaltochelatase CobS
MSQQVKLVPKQLTFKEAFGEQFSEEFTIQGYEPSNCQYVPVKDPDWVWDKRLLRDLCVWWNQGKKDPLYVFGSTGAGKSSGLRNFCASLNVPMYERTVYRGLEFAELVTSVDLVDGNTITNYGLLPLAMGAEGFPGVFCANEIDRADDGMLTGLYEVLEGQPLVTNVAGADLVRPMPGYHFVATGNTSMRGDFTGLYVGAAQKDIAFLDRFLKVKAFYLAEDSELQLLQRAVPDMQSAVLEGMVKVANDIRDAFMGNSESGSALPLTMSTRTLLRWARYTYSFRGAEQQGIQSIYYALDRAFLYSAEGDEAVREAILELVEGRLGERRGSAHA